MAKTTRSIMSGVFGVTAGLGATVPAFTCSGACASCFACAGMAGAVASVLLARLALRARRDPAGATTSPPGSRDVEVDRLESIP